MIPRPTPPFGAEKARLARAYFFLITSQAKILQEVVEPFGGTR